MPRGNAGFTTVETISSISVILTFIVKIRFDLLTEAEACLVELVFIITSSGMDSSDDAKQIRSAVSER